MTMGVVIASTYNIVLHTFDSYAAGCFTHLPLRSPPLSEIGQREIAIGRINNNHFVQNFLHQLYYPIPPIPTWWWNHKTNEALAWADKYLTRIKLWCEITRTTTSTRDSQFIEDSD